MTINARTLCVNSYANKFALLIIVAFLLHPMTLLAEDESGLDQICQTAGDCTLAYKATYILAEKGDLIAQFVLGLMYYNGKGVTKNYEESARWYGQAAKQGHGRAQYNLALMYDNGKGVPLDKTESVRWFMRAAEQGLAEAQLNLGLRYAIGEGIPKNYVQAYFWQNLSASQGNELAVAARNLTEIYMTKEQVAEAQRLSMNFRPQKEAYRSDE